MDAFINSVIQLLIDWGIPGLFLSALLAGSIVPFSSELVLVALVEVGLSPVTCVLAAALGNTLGGMTCYYMGASRQGRLDREILQSKKGESGPHGGISARQRGHLWRFLLSFRL